MSATAVGIHPRKSVGPAAGFGLDELVHALQGRGYSVVDERADIKIVLAYQADRSMSPEPSVKPLGFDESYALIWQAPDTLVVTGSDDRGLMYGCLDLAEQLELGVNLDTVSERRAEPELAVRGVHLFLHNEFVIM